MKNYLKNSIIYQVYTRNFTKEGTFKAVTSKLDYIKDLGVDVVYVLPVSPIGEINRKGVLGSPYSIKDYFKINPELGNIDDFKELIDQTHKRNMKFMIDLVFNHTSRDSWIKENHPEWMFHDKGGNISNKVADWSDVFDLNTDNKDLINYLVSVVDYYATLGVDGFRFDVASLVSKEFFIQMKEMLNKKHPETILLAESVHPGFVNSLRSQNYHCLSDEELFEVGFDLLYPYDSYENLRNYLQTGEIRWLDYFKFSLLLEDSMTNSATLRIRCMENHDQKRLFEFTKDKTLLRNLVALYPFMNGPMFIYNGLETKADHLESLFDKDEMSWEFDEEWLNFVKKLIAYKKDPKNINLNNTSVFLTKGENLALRNNFKDGSFTYGLFSLTGKETIINDNELIDGVYKDILSGNSYEIKNHEIAVKEPLYLIKA